MALSLSTIWSWLDLQHFRPHLGPPQAELAFEQALHTWRSTALVLRETLVVTYRSAPSKLLEPSRHTLDSLALTLPGVFGSRHTRSFGATESQVGSGLHTTALSALTWLLCPGGPDTPTLPCALTLLLTDGSTWKPLPGLEARGLC